MSLTNLCIRKYFSTLKAIAKYGVTYKTLFSKITNNLIHVLMLRCSEPYFYFSTAIFGDIDDIMWVTLCYWMNLEVFIYHAISFLFSHHYLFLTETVGNMIFARSVAIWHFRSLMNDMFLSLCSKSILVCMHSNHVQNQSKVSSRGT